MLSTEKSKLLRQFFQLCIIFNNSNSLQEKKKSPVTATLLVLSGSNVTYKFCTNFSLELDWLKAREAKYFCALIKDISHFFIFPDLFCVLSSAVR